MAQDYLDQLADFVVATRLDDLDAATVSAARNVVLDTIGAIIAGSRRPENAAFARLAAGMGGPGGATIIGQDNGHDGGAQHSDGVPAVWAAMVNATAGVALEMDEGNRLGGGHPAIHILPGALAVGEERDCTGKAVLESVIVGYEITSRIGGATQVRPEIHSHGTWGTIGAAATTARLLGFDAAQTRQAMNLAMSMSPANTWTPCLEGATVRNLYPGRSGFQGIMAAHLSQCGFTGIADGPADLYANILGQGFNPAKAIDGLGAPGHFRIGQNYFKFHACCLYNHPALDAVQSLLRRERFTADLVTQVAVVAPPIAGIMTDPAPPNMLAAKFSIPYAVAAAIHYGTAGVSAFYPEQVNDADIRRLAQRVSVTADPLMDLRRYDYPAAKVTVNLQDGRALSASVTAHRGDYTNPASADELHGKFRSLAQGTLGAARTPAVIDAVLQMDELASIGELTRLLGSE